MKITILLYLYWQIVKTALLRKRDVSKLDLAQFISLTSPLEIDKAFPEPSGSVWAGVYKSIYGCVEEDHRVALFMFDHLVAAWTIVGEVTPVTENE